MKEHLSDDEIVELTALLTLVNLDRFNAALAIGSAGLSKGMACVPPDRPEPAAASLAAVAEPAAKPDGTPIAS
ncbi:MAG TPA: hypothetical protein VMA77_19585 [Solirubrobacteraceae bacterium]|nr:hypothetical protein [Solirubrobacteraceae bacterium]